VGKWSVKYTLAVNAYGQELVERANKYVPRHCWEWGVQKPIFECARGCEVDPHVRCTHLCAVAAMHKQGTSATEYVGLSEHLVRRHRWNVAGLCGCTACCYHTTLSFRRSIKMTQRNPSAWCSLRVAAMAFVNSLKTAREAKSTAIVARTNIVAPPMIRHL
jgi:hypothetical protein